MKLKIKGKARETGNGTVVEFAGHNETDIWIGAQVVEGRHGDCEVNIEVWADDGTTLVISGLYWGAANYLLSSLQKAVATIRKLDKAEEAMTCEA